MIFGCLPSKYVSNLITSSIWTAIGCANITVSSSQN